MDLKQNIVEILATSLKSINSRNTLIQSISGVADVTSPNGRNTTELQSATGDRLLFKRTCLG